MKDKSLLRINIIMLIEICLYILKCIFKDEDDLEEGDVLEDIFLEEEENEVLDANSDFSTLARSVKKL